METCPRTSGTSSTTTTLLSPYLRRNRSTVYDKQPEEHFCGSLVPPKGTHSTWRMRDVVGPQRARGTTRETRGEYGGVPYPWTDSY